MKKNYSKPLIVIETFQLDAAVAANCEIALGHAIGDCWNNTNDKYVFNWDLCSVDLTPADDDGNDTICYHGPSLTGNVVYINS